jgi:uncharacterized cupredoxin-like copper-binding protein
MEDGGWMNRAPKRRTPGRLLLAAVLPLALSVLGAAACGGDDDDDGATATQEPTATERSETPDATDGEASPSPTFPPADTVAPFTLSEWSILGEKARARPGTVTFEVTNEGEFNHQFLVIRTDTEKDELPRKANDEGADESDLDVVGRIDEIAPGGSDEVEIDVEAGQYVLICNLAPGGESHYLNGMYAEFEITTVAPLDSPTPNPTQ